MATGHPFDMGARIFRPDMDQSRFDSAGIGSDYYREVAERYWIPKIAERNRQVLNVAPDLYHFFQRSYSGRRCSCWLGVETSPSSSCLVCFGTGTVVGYQKYGWQTEVFDATAESAAVGVVLDYDQITRPLSFRLINCAMRGYIDFTMPIRGGSMDAVDLASLHAVAPRGSRVKAAVKLFSEVGFTALSMEAIRTRLAQGAVEGGLHIRVLMERDSVTAPSPKFSHLRVRYKTLPEDQVRADIPRSEEANRSSEFGFYEDIATKSMFLDGTLRSVTTEDLFRSINTGRTYKVFSVNPNAPAGILTSWDIGIRAVVNSERYTSVP